MLTSVAAVHHAALLAIARWGPHGRSEGQTGLLDHRQAIHVGPDQQGRPAPVPKHGDDTGLADLLGHGETELAHPRCELGGGLDFLEGQFRMRVEIAIKRQQIGHFRVDRPIDCLSCYILCWPGRSGLR